MNNKLITYLLENNLEHNNYRVLQTIFILVVLIIPVTSFMKLRNWTSEALTFQKILLVTILCMLLLILLFFVVRKFGKLDWSKWLVITAIFGMLVSFRSIAYNSVETHALFYLVIVLSVFYFDFKLVLYTTALCIAGDYILVMYFPSSSPDGGAVGQGIRYLNYLWSGLAAAIGTSAARQLLELSTQLKMSNEMLQRDIEKEQQLERILKEFIATVSHELKSPLSIVRGYAEAVRDGFNPHKHQQYLDVILDETDNMEKLITNMLNLSELENGSVHLHWKIFDLNRLTEKVLNRLEAKLAEKNLEIEKSAVMPIMVHGDEAKIEICLLNLISNAIQQSFAGGKIYINYNCTNEKVEFSIENEGLPIQEDDLDSIWQPFYRAEKSRSKEYGGTGLGLTITQQILELHHTTCQVENTNRGVRFFFTIQNGLSPDNSVTEYLGSSSS
jgi:signal transduction histidine kinase